MEEFSPSIPNTLEIRNVLCETLPYRRSSRSSSSGGRKSPVNHRAASAPKFGMVGGHQGFNFRVEPAIHAADALHEPHGVPVNVVVYQPARVLEVEPFGKHVGRDQDAGSRL